MPHPTPVSPDLSGPTIGHRQPDYRGLALALLLAALLPISGCKATKRFFARLHHPRTAKSAPNTTDYADNVEQLIAQPHLAMLRWPDFDPDQPTLQKFYADRDDELAWIRDGKPTQATDDLIRLFTDAANKGLNPEDYDASRWPGRVLQLQTVLKKHDTSDAAQDAVASFDVAVTIDAIRYLEDLHLGRINPQALNFDIDVPTRRAAFDVATLLNNQIVDASDAPTVAASVEPQNPLYKATEAALPTYRTLAMTEAAAAPDQLPALAEGVKPIAPGGSYDAIPDLVARLKLEGDAPADLTAADGSKTYTRDIADAVKHFQDRHGLATDGKLGQNTIDALNVPMSVRVQQIDDALERWRWLPDNYIQPRILVNLPEFMLRAYKPDHSLDFTMRVVDGEAKGNHDTPLFVRLMRYVVFRPYWNLPPSIIKKDLVPHVERSGPGYIAEHGYEVYKNDGTVITSFTAADLEHVRYNVRQKPGPQNSLGLVKFLFPNEYDVYMHSTPELALFSLARRDKSHGCVRLQHADAMALWVLSGDQPDPETQTRWDEDSIATAMNGTDNNKTYNLKTPLPVVLTYLTAMANEDGTMHFFSDIYGYDKELEAALAKGRPYERAPMKINPKLIPGETE
jgi:murein L,D-transpeptidase YcbB/YkuD